MSCSSPMLPAAKLASSVPFLGVKGRGGIPDLQVGRGALQQGRLDEAGGRERVDGEVRRGRHPRAVLQGGDPAVDGRDRASEGVEGRHQRV